MSATNVISDAERTGSLGDKGSLREVLDFLVTEETWRDARVRGDRERARHPFRKRSSPSCATASLPNTTTWRHSRRPAASH
jgi:hypothetical protein